MSERLRDKYPMFFAFGAKQTFLATEEAVKSEVTERIRSIWPFLVKRVLAFHASLKVRERTNFDPEDTLTELWIELAENDHCWQPDRGKYITFAASVADRALCAIRDRARTVHSPRNSSCRMKEYAAEEAEGTISPKRALTALSIQRTISGIQAIPAKRSEVDRAEDRDCFAETEEFEVLAKAQQSLKQAIARILSTEEAMVIGRLSGLWGREPVSVWQLAWETGRDQDEVRRIKARALAKIKHYLRSTLEFESN